MNRLIKSHSYLLLIPILLGIFGAGRLWDQAHQPVQPTYRLTVWADSLKDTMLNAVPVVSIAPREALRASAVLLKNENEIIPFKNLGRKKFLLVTVGDSLPELERTLNLYAPVKILHFKQLADAKMSILHESFPVILAMNKSRFNAYALRNFVHQVNRKSELVVVNFGDYMQVKAITHAATLLQMPNAGFPAQSVAGQILFGGLGVQGGIHPEMALALGLKESYSTQSIRLSYAVPEQVGIFSDSLFRIKSIIEEAIANYAIPGCQVLLAQKGKVIYHKAFGYHTYEKKQPVKLDDLYDLASITKIASTTLATMKLVEEEKIQLEQPLHHYFQDATYKASGYMVYDTMRYADMITRLESHPRSDTIAIKDSLLAADSLFLVGRWVPPDNKKRLSRIFNIPIHNLLTHTSGIQASLPIDPFKRTVSRELYRFSSDNLYSLPVANELFMKTSFRDSLWNLTKSLRPDSIGYRYSCVNMILLQRVIDSVTQMVLPDYLDQHFYQELGLQTMTYNPKDHFEESQLVPTSRDKWRRQLLCGTVHDPTAAMLGGVSGNAGLFSNANDLAILAQMWLNKGQYGDFQFLNDSLVDAFTSRQKGHRGYGFDKPPRHNDYYVAPSASLETYGHTGFTGTCLWVDPEHEIVFVFLSNRIHPDEKNTRLNEMKIRRRVHQVIYDALGIPKRGPDHRPESRPIWFFTTTSDSTSNSESSVATLSAP